MELGVWRGESRIWALVCDCGSKVAVTGSFCLHQLGDEGEVRTSGGVLRTSDRLRGMRGEGRKYIHFLLFVKILIRALFIILSIYNENNKALFKN